MYRYNSQSLSVSLTAASDPSYRVVSHNALESKANSDIQMRICTDPVTSLNESQFNHDFLQYPKPASFPAQRTYQLNRPAALGNPQSQQPQRYIVAQNFPFKHLKLDENGGSANVSRNRTAVVLPRPTNPNSSQLVKTKTQMPDMNGTNVSSPPMPGQTKPLEKFSASQTLRPQTTEPMPTYVPLGFSISKSKQLCTNNNSQTEDTPSATIQKVSDSDGHSVLDYKRPKIDIDETKYVPFVHVDLSPAKAEPQEKKTDNEMVNSTENVCTSIKLETDNRKQSCIVSTTETVDHLADTINRVAKGEGELRLRTSVEDIGNSHQNQKRTEPRILAKRKKHAKSKQKLKVTVQKSNTSPIDVVREKNKSEIDAKYPTGSSKNGYTCRNVYFPDAITVMEYRKLSSVSGHHLLSLTDKEKQFLRNRGYLESCQSSSDQDELEANVLAGNKTKGIEKPIHVVSVENSKAESKDTNILTTALTNNPTEQNYYKKTSISDQPNAKTLQAMKFPVVKITKLDNHPQYMSYKVISCNSANNCGQSQGHQKFIYDHNNKVLPNFQSYPVNKSVVPSVTADGKGIRETNICTKDNSSTVELGKSSCTASKTRENECDKYIKLGNVSYKLVQNNKEKILIKKTWADQASPNSVLPPTSTGVMNSEAMKKECDKIYETKTGTTDPLTSGRNNGPRKPDHSKAVLQVYGKVFNKDPRQSGKSVLNESSVVSKTTMVSINEQLSNGPGGCAMPQALSASFAQNDPKLKLRLEIPIKIINPKDIVDSRITKPEQLTSQSTNLIRLQNETMSPRQCSLSDGRARKRKTLPAPKPRDQVGTPSKRFRPRTSIYMTQKSLYRNGFRKTVKALLQKSSNPFLQVAESLDLIPKKKLLKQLLMTEKAKQAINKILISKGNQTNKTRQHHHRQEQCLNLNKEETHSANIVEVYKIATVVQIYKNDVNKCTYRIQRVNLTLRPGQNNQLKRWFPLANRPCVLHFSEDGGLTSVEVEDIVEGLFVVLDCVECHPAEQKRKVFASLSVYPPCISSIPPNTLALIFDKLCCKDVSDTSDDSEIKLENVIAKFLGEQNCEYSGSRYSGKRHCSLADNTQLSLLPKVNERFESKFCEPNPFPDNTIDSSNNNINTTDRTLSMVDSTKRCDVAARFSERALALKIKQNELFESCKQLTITTKQSKKRKLDDEDYLNVDII